MLLAGVTDPDTERARALAERLETTVHDDPAALVASPEVDAVVIASPGFVHEEQVSACLDAGKPVLCEKPLTTDDASRYELVQEEAALGRTLVQVGFMRRYDAEYVALKNLIAPAGSAGFCSCTAPTGTRRCRTTSTPSS